MSSPDRYDWRDIAWTVLVSAVLVVLFAHVAKVWGAPAPRPRNRSVPLTVQAFAGSWTVTWGGVHAPATMHADGRWECRWGALRYVGTWGISGGRLWIQESSNPQEPKSWVCYGVRIVPGTRYGRIDVGSANTEFRLDCRKPERLKMPKGAD